jgi:hypothetical protein
MHRDATPAIGGMKGIHTVIKRNFDLHKEASFKRQQGAFDKLTHLMERYANRLSFQSLNLVEGYLHGRLNVGLKLRARGSDHEFHLVIARCDVGLEQNVGLAVSDNEEGRARLIGCGQVAPIGHQVMSALKTQSNQTARIHRQGSHQIPCSEIERRNRNPVFFVSVEEVEGTKVRVPSGVRLCLTNQFAGPCREELFYFHKFGVAMLYGIGEWESDAGLRASVPFRENGKNVIQGLSQVLEDIPDADGHRFRDRARQLESPDFLATLNINLRPNFIGVCGPKLADIGFDLLDFGFGPFGLLPTTGKRRFGFHDIEPYHGQLRPDK